MTGLGHCRPRVRNGNSAPIPVVPGMAIASQVGPKRNPKIGENGKSLASSHSGHPNGQLGRPEAITQRACPFDLLVRAWVRQSLRVHDLGLARTVSEAARFRTSVNGRTKTPRRKT